jgi:hypothetical protein
MMIHEFRNRATDSQRRTLAPSIIARKSSGPECSTTNALRQRLGNRGVQRLMSEIIGHSKGDAQTRSPAIQAKLTVSQPGDVHEQEADRVANAVMRMPESSVQETPLALSSAGAPNHAQRMCTDCDDELGKKTGAAVRRKEQTADAPPVTQSVAANIQSLRGGGSALPAATRAFFEPRFGADFSGVRVHTDERANATAKSISAKAFTLGNDIAFASGQYSPGSSEGQHLLAHELTHTVQQQGSGEIQRAPGDFLDDLGKDLESLGKGLSKEAEKRVRQELKALGALPGAGAVFSKSGCPKNFCNPYADVSLAKTNLMLAAPVLIAGI